VNCTGLGSRDLFNDTEILPSRGQVIAIKPNGFNKIVADDSGHNSLLYIIPRKNDIILGGTVLKGDWSLTEDKDTTKEILAKARKIDPIFNKVEILEVKIGLRPARTKIRLERQNIIWEKGGVRKYKVVIHNYGHGGSGFTVSWGCAKQVLILAIKVLSEGYMKSKF